MRKAFSVFALALIAGCETTAATPEFYPLAGLKDAYAMAAISCTGRSRCSGAEVEIQVQSLHEGRRYVGLLVRGAPCGGSDLSGRQIVERFALEPLASRNEGIDDRETVGVPIHQLVKSNYSALVYDTKTKRVLACGALTSGRPI